MTTTTNYKASGTDIGNRFDEKTTTITAGTAGPTSNVSYDDNANRVNFQFKIPRITVNSAGRVTSYSTSVITVIDEVRYYCGVDTGCENSCDN